MLRTYPVVKPTTAPGTGSLLFEHLIQNIGVPARATHVPWYMGERAKLGQPDKYAFRGDLPVGKTLEVLTLEGQLVVQDGEDLPENIRPGEGGTFLYTVTEADRQSRGRIKYIQAGDLSDRERTRLGIPSTAKPREKVFNVNFKPFEQLDQFTRWSNELVPLSVVKSISSYCQGVLHRVNYSEVDVLGMVDAAFADLSGPQMTYLLHGNHLAWAALQYIRSDGNVRGEISTEFFSQNPPDFYAKDLGTVLPALYFTVALLGQDPLDYDAKLDVEIWGSAQAAQFIKEQLPRTDSNVASI